MATKLTLVIAGDEPGTSKKVYVEEPFDHVMDQVLPTVPAMTPESARLRRIFNKADGTGRVMIPEGNIAWIEENADPDIAGEN